MYASAGYDFLFRTDHWTPSDVVADDHSYPLLWLDGMELDGVDVHGRMSHIVCLGALKNIPRDLGLTAGLEAARAQGALLVLAHPHWSGNTLDDTARWRLDGVEIYNHISHWMNGKGDGLVHWDAALATHPNTLSFAVDDAHVTPEHPGWNGGWIVVNAGSCSRPEIMSAIRGGNFYSSCGPDLHAIEWDGSALHLSTSPVRFVRLVGPGPQWRYLKSPDDSALTEVTMPVPTDWDYVYAEIEDAAGRRAWTNTLFVANGRAPA